MGSNNMKKPIALCACIAVGGLMGMPANAQIPGFNGSWSLSQDKSEGPKAVCEYLHYAVTASEEHYIVDELEKDGTKFNTEYRAKYDGKEYANKNLVTGVVNYVKLRKVFDRTEQLTNIRKEPGPNGTVVSKVTGYYIRVLSPDGKSITSTLIDAEGQVTAVRVFEKVSDTPKPHC